MKRKQTPPFPEMPADREFPVRFDNRTNSVIMSIVSFLGVQVYEA